MAASSSNPQRNFFIGRKLNKSVEMGTFHPFFATNYFSAKSRFFDVILPGQTSAFTTANRGSLLNTLLKDTKGLAWDSLKKMQ